MSDSLQPHGLYSPWNSLGQNTGVGSLSLLQGGLPNPEIEPRSPTLQADSFFSKCFIIIILFYFTILYWFCHTSTCIRHGCTHVAHSKPPFHLPPHTIPLGHSSAPAPSFLYPASNLDWRFVSYMILYMFQCLSPKSLPPSLFHRVQKTVIYICRLILYVLKKKNNRWGKNRMASTKMFNMIQLFTANNQKQTQYLSTPEWINN